MRVYVRKMFPHDITHEVSVKTEIVNDFFEGNTSALFFTGRKSGFTGTVTINNATDPRFGGDFKSLVTNEGRADVNDILLIYKLDATNYVLEIVKQDDARFFGLMVLFREKSRHAFIETEDNII